MEVIISVVIPLYNKEKTIVKTLQTVLNQSFQDFEIVIVNDGSTDGSAAEVSRIHDSRIRLINQPNAGVSAARNHGIEEASGEFVAFLDADDEWKPDYLKTQMGLVKKYSDCDVFATRYSTKREDEKTKQTVLKGISFTGEDGILSNYFEIASISDPPVWTSAVVVRKSKLKEIGGFPIGVTSGEDLLTWARLAERNKIAFTKKVCAVYNLGEGYDFSNLPPRRQDAGDPVGTGLIEIYKRNNRLPGIKKYLSHWHKMRASVAVRYGERFETISESFKALYYTPMNFKVIPFIILSMTPGCIRRKIISMKKNV